jgi:hypothetical protein
MDGGFRCLPFLFATTLSVTGCDAVMRVAIVEASAQPVFSLRGSGWPSPCTLHAFEIIALDREIGVWRIVSSGSRIQAITYATVPPGFTQDVPPQPLLRGVEYEVRLSGGNSCALAVPARFRVASASSGQVRSAA